jgi:hypothetical protein
MEVGHMNMLHAKLSEERHPLVSFSMAFRSLSIEELVKKLDLGPHRVALTRLAIFNKIQVVDSMAIEIDEYNSIALNQSFELKEDKKSIEFCGVDIDFLGNNQELAQKILATLGTVKEPRVTNKGSISVLIATQNGIDTASVGRAAMEWVPGNYTESNVRDIEFVVKELNKKKPAGRIVILDGVAGSGKTTLVRAIINRIPKSHFIIIPANMVSSLGDPSFIGFFVGASHLHDAPLTLVVEDGDYCLVPRGQDNISAISTLLNITDGIIGQMLDIRVIITTNVKIDEVDEAVMRPGRLLKQITFNALTPEHANEVYERITGDKGTFTESKTLAEIYVSTKADVPAMVKKKITKMGFGS